MKSVDILKQKEMKPCEKNTRISIGIAIYVNRLRYGRLCCSRSELVKLAVKAENLL